MYLKVNFIIKINYSSKNYGLNTCNTLNISCPLYIRMSGKLLGVNDAYVCVSITTLVELSVAQAKESKFLPIKMKYLHIQILVTCVSFIPFFVFGHFWRRSYENIRQSLFTFCKARWARRKKMERKSRN